MCWGHLLAGGTTPVCVPVPIKAGPSFRERFCTTCRARGVQINASRLRVVCSGCVPTNKHGGGCWNEGPDADGWPPHRVVNQTINCIGPPIVILKFATSAPLHRLGEFSHGSCGWYTFRIGRTLAPLLGPHAHPPLLALAPTAGVMHMTPPTLPATPTETGRTLDEPVSSASLWTQGQRITSQASLTSTEPSHVIGIPLHEAIPGVFFSPQVISPRDELQQHRSAALHSAAIAAAAATSAAAAAVSVALSFAAAYDLPLAGLASVPTGLASCATAPAQPGHASMVDTTSPTDLLQRRLTAGDVARSEARVQQLVSPSAIPAPVPAVPLHNPRAVAAALETAGRAVAPPPPPPEGQVLHAPSDACAASALLDLSGGAAAGIAPQGAAATGVWRANGIGVPWQGVVDMPPPVPLPPVGGVPPAGAPTAVQVRGGMPAGTPPPSPPEEAGRWATGPGGAVSTHSASRLDVMQSKPVQLSLTLVLVRAPLSRPRALLLGTAALNLLGIFL